MAGGWALRPPPTKFQIPMPHWGLHTGLQDVGKGQFSQKISSKSVMEIWANRSGLKQKRILTEIEARDFHFFLTSGSFFLLCSKVAL